MESALVELTESAIIELTASAIKEHRFDIHACGKTFFPSDAFGSNSTKGRRGVPITLLAKGLKEPIKTDIPSDNRSGHIRWFFRKRSWVKKFYAVNQLKAGDMVKIDRFDDYKYKLIPFSKHNNKPSTKMMNHHLRVLSLFSGCGGMDLGFEGNFDVLSSCVNKKIHPDWISKEKGNWINLRRTCFETVFANDIMDAARRAWLSYLGKRGVKENVFHPSSIVDLVKQAQAGDRSIFPANIDVLTGGFPCQDFSNAGKRKGFASHRSHNGELLDAAEPTIESRGSLYIWMRNVIDIVRPKVFIAENVKALTTLADARRIIENDFKNIGQEGYIVLSRILHAVEYGVPQTRERIFFYGFSKAFLKRDALKALQSDPIPAKYDPFPPITHRLNSKLYSPDQMAFLNKFVSTGEVLKDLPEPSPSVKDASQNSFSGAAYYGRHCQGNVEVDLRLPCFTIRAEHHGNIEFRRLSFEHGGKMMEELKASLPERRLTVRECARIQTFPDDYEFVRKDISKNDEYRISGTEGYVLVGNAVPPLLAYHLASRLQNIWPLYFKRGKQ